MVSGAAIAVSVASLAAVACSSAYGDATTNPPQEAGAEAAADSGVEVDAATPTKDGAVTDAGSAAFVLASGLGDLGGISATETAVYFTVRKAPGIGTPGVKQVPISGGQVATIASGSAGSAPGPIVALAPWLTWVDPGVGAVYRRALTGGSTTSLLLSTDPAPVALAAGTDVVAIASNGAGGGSVQTYDGNFGSTGAITSASNPFDVAAVGVAIWWTAPGTQQVGRGSLVGPQALPFEGETDCQFIVADKSGAYWTRPSAGLVRAFVPQTSALLTLAAMETAPSSLAVDDSGLYWLTGDGKLRRKRLDQELPPATLDQGFKSAFAGTHIRAIALTSSYVVWLTTDGSVLRMSK